MFSSGLLLIHPKEEQTLFSEGYFGVFSVELHKV